MTRRNRVDPWGDLHAVSERGMFTGNRGCLVDGDGILRLHHRGSLWIICEIQFRGWKHPLDSPRTWTPLFFLDDATAMAAGHRPCGLCRRVDYLDYRDGVATALGRPVDAADLNRVLASERLRRGRGLMRSQDRRLTVRDFGSLPKGTVVVDPASRLPLLVTDRHLQPFGFGGWGVPMQRPIRGRIEVLTPPTSVQALAHGFTPRLHPSAIGQ